MNRILYLSAALLYAGITQAENGPMEYHPFAENPQAVITLSDYPPATAPMQTTNELSQFYPTLYCGAVPKERVVLNEYGYKETAGRKATHEFDGETFKLEERYITIKGQKCAIKVYGILEDSEHKEQDMITRPVHGTFLKALTDQDDLEVGDYFVSLFYLLSEYPGFKSCHDKSIPKGKEPETSEEHNLFYKKLDENWDVCLRKLHRKLNRKGFVGYYFIPRKEPNRDCESKNRLFSGFYYLDGKAGLLNEPYPCLPPYAIIPIFKWDMLRLAPKISPIP